MPHRFLILPLLLFLALSCNENKQPEEQGGDLLSQRSAFEIVSLPEILKPQDSLLFSAVQTDTSLHSDSLLLFVDKQRLSLLEANKLQFRTTASGLGLGQHQFRLLAYKNGKEIASASAGFIIRSDSEPESWTFEVVKTLPHNTASFTQGLEWHQGELYEGTGLNGKSAVMKLQPATGESLLKTSLSQEHFGEGITILNNRLYQLTWQSHRAFVYTLPELSQLTSLGYPTEGWGLSHLKDELLMSDGSEKIYFLRPDDFSLIRSIEVWDHRNPVSELNELEVVDGILYANKYQTDTIVKIDPKDGKVLAYINMEGLLKQQERQGNEDVLNGIAWNPADKLWYLTGKNWPKMFAVRLLKKKAV